MNDKEFAEYVRKHGWIKLLNTLTLKELFELQRRVKETIYKVVISK